MGEEKGSYEKLLASNDSAFMKSIPVSIVVIEGGM